MKNIIVLIASIFFFDGTSGSALTLFKSEHDPEAPGWFTVSPETDHHLLQMKQKTNTWWRKAQTMNRDYSRTVGVLEAVSIRLPRLQPSDVLYEKGVGRDVFTVKVTYPRAVEKFEKKVMFYTYLGDRYTEHLHEVRGRMILRERSANGTITYVFIAELPPSDGGKTKVGFDLTLTER